MPVRDSSKSNWGKKSFSSAHLTPSKAGGGITVERWKAGHFNLQMVNNSQPHLWTILKTGLGIWSPGAKTLLPFSRDTMAAVSTGENSERCQWGPATYHHNVYSIKKGNGGSSIRVFFSVKYVKLCPKGRFVCETFSFSCPPGFALYQGFNLQIRKAENHL